MAAARSLRCFALVVPVALLAVACTGSSATPNLSPVSSAPPASVVSSSVLVTPSASLVYPADVPLTGHNVRPGEKPPVYPAAARPRTQDGANAFVEFFLRTWDWAYATTNPSYMRHYFGPSCGLCSGIATGISKTASELHHYEGGRFLIHSVQATPIEPVIAPADFCTKAYIDASAQSIVDGKGNVVNGEPSHSNVAFKLCTQSAASGWRITYWARA
jgi:hypothetical protein